MKTNVPNQENLSDIGTVMKLMKEKNYKKILNILRGENANFGGMIYNDNTIAHYASLTDEREILDRIFELSDSYFMKGDKNGNTPLHLLSQYGFNETLKKICKKTKSYHNLLNNKNETFVHNISCPKTINHIIDYIDSSVWNIVDNFGNTILLQIINKCETENDEYWNLLIKILDNPHVNLNIPERNSPIIFSIMQNKWFIVEYLIKRGANINTFNIKYQSVLYLLSYYKKYEIIEKILKNSDDTLIGNDGKYNPLFIAVLNNDSRIVEILLSNKNLNFAKKTNKYYDTPLHFAILTNKTKSAKLIYLLLYYSDLNHQNIEGNTCLHLKADWESYSEILKEICENKNVRNIKNNEGKWISQNAAKYVTKSAKIEQSGVKLIINSDNKEFGEFNPKFINNLIYVSYLISKYDNLGVPMQYMISDKYLTVKYRNELLGIPKTENEQIIQKLITKCNSYSFIISPYFVVWGGEDTYFIHDEIEFHLLKQLKNDNIRFIYIKLTIVCDNFIHANAIIYDKNNGILERFEPYGIINIVDNKKLDEFIIDKLKNMLELRTNRKITYYSPDKLFSSVGFQTLSDDSNINKKKLGDPKGYCLAWTFWYIEMRITNPDVLPNVLIEQSIKLIINNYKNDNFEKFINFIRGYGSHLNGIKNNFLKNIGGNRSEFNDLIFKPKLKKTILEEINKILETKLKNGEINIQLFA